ncbi:unnamed protein product [Cuscuta campestris]|uniref:Uncharacterized protein n=1 Tax=Cuscuta campestris TaxID=132261 RepID=A0A484MWE1_9ASTE|nr:unnamed protein product [Cuscuta campestris]
MAFGDWSLGERSSDADDGLQRRNDQPVNQRRHPGYRLTTTSGQKLRRNSGELRRGLFSVPANQEAPAIPSVRVTGSSSSNGAGPLCSSDLQGCPRRIGQRQCTYSVNDYWTMLSLNFN